MFSQRLGCPLNVQDDFADASCADPQTIHPLRIYPFRTAHQAYLVAKQKVADNEDKDDSEDDYCFSDSDDDAFSLPYTPNAHIVPLARLPPAADEVQVEQWTEHIDLEPAEKENEDMSGGVMHESPAMRGSAPEWMSGTGGRITLGHERDR